MKYKKRLLIIKGLFFAFLAVSLILFLSLIFSPINLTELSGSSLLYLFGKLAGLIGFLFLAILIFFGDTARFFDRFFGMDKIIKFQRKFALITSLFVIFHPIFFILSDSFFLKYLIPNFASIPMALGTLGLYIFLIVSIFSVLYKRISYDIWQYIHIGTYFLFFFSLYHAFKVGSNVDNIFVKSLFYIILLGIIIGIIYRTNYKIKQRKNKFYVKNINWKTKDTFTLTLKTNKKFNFKAGQFCFLRINKNKLYARHPFTISSPPNEKDLEFTIKLQGRFTKIASQLKEGEEIIVEGPFGTFTVEDDNKNLVFIAGGVGITPFMSIIKNHSDLRKQQNITLLYGSKTKEDIIFRDELDTIQKDWFTKIYLLSNANSSSEMYERGYINKTLISKHIKNLNNTLFYICGPEQMKKCVKKILANLGVKNQNIKTESFFW